VTTGLFGEGMRILHILRDVRNNGNGVTNAVVDMAISQRQLGHTLAVVAEGGEFETLLKTCNVSHRDLRQGRRPVSFAQSCFEFRKIVREFQPDVIHCHLVPGLIMAMVMRPFLTCALISHVHNIQLQASVLMGLADGMVVGSGSGAEIMRSMGIPKRKIFVVRNCVVGSLRWSCVSFRKPAPLSQPAIVTVAGMNRRKNIDGLIVAFDAIAADFPNVNLYLVGEGVDRPAFEALARRCRAADRIHFEGFQQDPRPYLERAAIFVLASRREAFGLVLHEAREVGAAIIGSDVDGIPEALDFGRAGLLVPAGDGIALANALRRLLGDPIERQKWATASRRDISKHNVQRMGEELLAVYRKVLGEEEGGQPPVPVQKLNENSESR